MNSLRMSFWIVPESAARATPCSSPATMKLARIGITAPFIVIDTADLLERDAVEEHLHVLDRVDRDPGLADVADHPRVVAVVAAVGREVEGDATPPAAPPPAPCGRRRSTPPPSRSPHTGGSSTAARRTSSPAARGCRARAPAGSRGGRARRGRARYRAAGRRSPPGVSQVRLAAACPSAPSRPAPSRRRDRHHRPQPSAFPSRIPRPAP